MFVASVVDNKKHQVIDFYNNKYRLLSSLINSSHHSEEQQEEEYNKIDYNIDVRLSSIQSNNWSQSSDNCQPNHSSSIASPLSSTYYSSSIKTLNKQNHCPQKITNIIHTMAKLSSIINLNNSNYILLLLSTLILLLSGSVQAQNPPQPPLVTDNYYGTPLGALTTPAGTPSLGQVYAPDENTIFIKGFTYNGHLNPFSYFQAGGTIVPDGTGFTISDENGSLNPLGDYKNKDLILKLPEGRSIRDIRWFSVWSRNNHLSMGHVNIPIGIELPRPLDLPPLTGFAHEVRSDPITIVDAQTVLIPNFWYDGLGPAAYWWATKGPRQSPQGLRLKDEKGSVRPLRTYRGETVLLSLPDTKTIYDFDWLGIWCEEFQVDFGNVHIPHHARVPPSPAMLGLKPEAKLNCEVLDDARGFEMRWILDNDDIVLQLVGKMAPHEYMSIAWGRDDTRSLMVGADAIVAWIDAQGQGHAEDYYLSAKEPCIGARGACPDVRFPGATDSVTLLHAAVVNGYRMITLKRPQLGVDEQYDQHIYSDGQQAVMWAYGPLNHRNEASYHIRHQFGNRYIDFARQPLWNCPSPDQALMNQRKWQQLIAAAASSSSIVANQTSTAITSPSAVTNNNNNQTVRDTRSSEEFVPTTPAPSIDDPTSFTTIPTVSSITPPTAAPSVIATTPSPMDSNNPQMKPWNIPKIVCPKDRTFWAQMGPVGGPKRGYQAITGRKGWGIAWYINGLLIPELVLRRGETYTFFVEGGNDQQNSARRHPLYLTTSDEGGFEYKTDEERRRERVFGGVGITSNGTILPTAEGRLCKWKITEKTNIEDMDEAYETFDQFHQTLTLDCEEPSTNSPGQQNGNSAPPPQPGMIRFTPDHNTPDLLYYQCYIHRYMGWKIHIVDHCPGEPQPSMMIPPAIISHSVIQHVAPPSTTGLQIADSIVSPVKTELSNNHHNSLAIATNNKNKEIPVMNRIQNLFQAKPASSSGTIATNHHPPSSIHLHKSSALLMASHQPNSHRLHHHRPIMKIIHQPSGRPMMANSGNPLASFAIQTPIPHVSPFASPTATAAAAGSGSSGGLLMQNFGFFDPYLPDTPSPPAPIMIPAAAQLLSASSPNPYSPFQTIQAEFQAAPIPDFTPSAANSIHHHFHHRQMLAPPATLMMKKFGVRYTNKKHLQAPLPKQAQQQQSVVPLPPPPSLPHPKPMVQIIGPLRSSLNISETPPSLPQPQLLKQSPVPAVASSNNVPVPQPRPASQSQSTPTAVKLQSGGFIPITNHNKYNRLWAKSAANKNGQKQKNKFNSQSNQHLNTENNSAHSPQVFAYDILRIRPVSETPAVPTTPNPITTFYPQEMNASTIYLLPIRHNNNSYTATTVPTTTSTTTTTTTTTMAPPITAPTAELKLLSWTVDNDENSRNVFSGLQYSNGLLNKDDEGTSDDDVDGGKPLVLQSSASTLFPIATKAQRNQTDHTILTDVLRLIAHNMELLQRQQMAASTGRSQPPQSQSQSQFRIPRFIDE